MNEIYHGIRHISPLQLYSRSGRRQALFQCHCGNFFKAALSNVKNRNTKSCGCRPTGKIIHGYATGNKIRGEAHSYYSAKKRCTNLNSKDYPDYGGRGIEFRFKSFVEFIDHIGDRPHPKDSIDRIDVNGHYEIGNVRWANAKQQEANKRKKVGA